MELTIELHTITNREIEQDSAGDYLLYETNRSNTFSSEPMAGDKVFLERVAFEPPNPLALEEQKLLRPIDLAAAQGVIDGFIQEPNRSRLLNAISRMEQDEDVFFVFNY